MKYFYSFISFIAFASLLQFSFGNASSDIEYGVAAAESSSDKENFCIIYNKLFSSLPLTKYEAPFHILKDESEQDWCDDHPGSDIKSKVLLLTPGNCTLITQARNVHDRGGEGVLFITRSGKVNVDKVNSTAAKSINMTFGMIGENSAERLKKMHPIVSIRLFAPYSLDFDFSLLVIWVLSVFTVAIGSYWSGLIRFAIYCKELSSQPGGARQLPNKPSVRVNTAEESSINISPYAVMGYVCFMGLMLVLLYFFFTYLVYFIIGLFVIASIIAIYSCLEPLVMRIQWSFCKSEFVYRTRSCNIDFRQILLIAFSFAVALFWLLNRKAKYAYVLQDILGIAFCIHMLRSIRLPSFKICTLLLGLLFFYDIFFVFITPYLTGKAESVMEVVATGGGKSNEAIPMVLKVPHFGFFNPISVCYQQFSILGFGDILVPGLLVSYCHGFDLVTSKRKIYFIITVTAYGIGLLITFVGLFMMNTAQPALLYLVPCTLIPPALVALCRGEFHALWIGFQNVARDINVQTDAEEQRESVPPVETNNSETLPPSSQSVNQSKTNDDVQNERNLLLR